MSKDNKKNECSPFLMCEDYDAYLESMSKTELLEYFHFVTDNYKYSLDKVTLENTELQKQVEELKSGKGLFISQDQIDWVCSLGVMVHIKEDSPVVLLNRHKYENTCADIDRRIFHFEEEKEQAIKNTVIEMIEEIDSVKEIFPNDISGYEKAHGWCMCIDKLKEIAKERYGVEVE